MRRLVIAAALAAATLASTPHAARALPGGFTDALVRGGYGTLTTVEPLPDGRLLVLAQAGSLHVVDPATGASNVALGLTVCASSERGLLGVAVDPAFSANGYLYVYSTRSVGGTCVNRVSRFTMAGATVNPASEVVLLDRIPSTGGNHNGGDLHVASDGYLYVAIGDAGTDPRGNSGSAGANDAAQDLSLLNGKIVRITTTGAVPPTNPIVGTPGARSCATAGTSAPATARCTELFAWGLRNPYRFAFDPNTGDVRFFLNDVGQNTWEEVDEGGIGRNYGWNLNEGPCRTGTECTAPVPGYSGPIVAYSHSATGGACDYITAGAFVPNGRWPEAFDGGYLFADGGCGRIWLRSADGTYDLASPFAETGRNVTDMAFGAGGGDLSLYYVTIGGELRRITYDAPAPSASAPLAFAAVTPQRVYDTRIGTGGAGSGPVRAGTSRLVDVQAPTGTEAVLVNVTLEAPRGPTYLQAFPPRTERPATSVVNATFAGETVANAAVLPVDADGNVVVHVSTTTNVVIDVLGHFTSAPSGAAAGRFVPVDPARLVDSREPAGDTNAYTRSPSGVGALLTLDVAGRLGVPDGAGAVALAVTGIDGTSPGAGFVTVYAGGSRPTASNLNTAFTGDIRTNLVVSALDADGDLNVYLENVDDVAVDVVGWFTGPGAPVATAGRYVALAPTRIVDTRPPALGFGPLADGATGSLDVAAVPDTAAAIAQNLTVTETSREGYLTAFAAGGVRNTVSNLVYLAPDQTRAAFALTRLGAGGGASWYAQHATQLVVDAYGYFTG
jgi:glucose/arabinose dehydrogenase